MQNKALGIIFQSVSANCGYNERNVVSSLSLGGDLGINKETLSYVAQDLASGFGINFAYQEINRWDVLDDIFNSIAELILLEPEPKKRVATGDFAVRARKQPSTDFEVVLCAATWPAEAYAGIQLT